MTDFTASNGTKVVVYTKSLSLETSGDAQDWIEPWAVDALREFFQHKRDEELDRWRWPENPNVVAQELNGALVRILDELTSAYSDYMKVNGSRYSFGDRGFDRAARAYFEAHPVKKPWHDAKPGEVWEINGFPAWRLESGAFMFDDESFLFTEDITRGRRIWPEDGA